MFFRSNIIRSIFFSVIFLILPAVIFSQPDPEWISRFNGPDNSYDIVANMDFDNSGNLYVYGSSNSTLSLFDFALIKYNESGSEIWRAVYNGDGNSTDQIFKGTADSMGNSYVTGFVTDQNGRNVITTAKYDSSGNLNWMKFFNSDGYTNGFGQDITLDNNGNVIICGFIRNVTGNYDIVTVKYSEDGTKAGSVFYAGSGNGDDLPVSVKADSQNNIFVTGSSKEGSNGSDILVLKYDPLLNNLWKRTFNGTLNSEDKASSSVLDDENSIYISGSLLMNSGSYDFFYAKISTSGNIQWQGTYNGIGDYFDLSYAVALDKSGNLFLTGLSFQNTTSGSEDILTLKISSSGNLIWNRVFNGIADGTDQGIDLKTDNEGNVYIGGGSDQGNVHLIYALLKYDPDGNLLWVKNYENTTLSEDFISGVLVDKNSDVYVTGISIGETTNFDIVTIKYSQTTGIVNNSNQLTSGFNLFQNYPNPFNPVTVIGYTIQTNEKVNAVINIYDNSGKIVRTINEGIKYPGYYEIRFSAKDGESELSSGIYYYQLSVTGNIHYSDTKKMILLK